MSNTVETCLRSWLGALSFDTQFSVNGGGMLHIVVSYGFQVQIWWRRAGCRLLPDHLEACLLADCSHQHIISMQKEQITVCLKHCYSLGSFLVLLGRRCRRLSLWLKLHPGSCFQAGRECQINLMNLCINSIRKISGPRSAWNPRNLGFSSCTLLFIPSVCPKFSLFLISQSHL